MVRAVTLDAAGTLFEVAEPVGATYARFAGRYGIDLVPAEVERRFGEAFTAAPPLAFAGGGPTRLPDHERAWWYAIVRRAFGAAATAPGFDACFAALFAHFGHPAAWRVFPDVPPALGRLRAQGRRLAVVSNFDERLPALLAALGLRPLLDAVVPSSRAGAAKPDPAIFHAALAALEVPNCEAVHAGDSIISDVEGARTAGMRAVLVDRRGRRPHLPPDTAVVTTLAELPSVVTHIDASR